jgi:hypothetical protein
MGMVLLNKKLKAYFGSFVHTAIWKDILGALAALTYKKVLLTIKRQEHLFIFYTYWSIELDPLRNA